MLKEFFKGTLYGLATLAVLYGVLLFLNRIVFDCLPSLMVNKVTMEGDRPVCAPVPDTILMSLFWVFFVGIIIFPVGGGLWKVWQKKRLPKEP